ncbi:STAS-like domain-containing protein [Methylobacterium sp. E-005]|uniref:STAS-like domain-containing protein n=1 Tax=Methylobacterium sp. E-005 TaxID=2836549 RepID=UPI001FBA287B|nr:STAS-like domain-containing protein [Methylobacterium sp. E-005]MCJ2086949.1 STAS-like domain-containing protein [Methylobacterium sp. E-005]
MAGATISIARNFSRYPSGRFRSDGPHNGQKFREEVLAPAMREVLRKSGKVTIILDDVAGLPASFLEEAFGGLVRSGFDKNEILSHLNIETSQLRLQRYPSQILAAIEKALPDLARAG